MLSSYFNQCVQCASQDCKAGFSGSVRCPRRALLAAQLKQSNNLGLVSVARLRDAPPGYRVCSMDPKVTERVMHGLIAVTRGSAPPTPHECRRDPHLEHDRQSETAQDFRVSVYVACDRRTRPSRPASGHPMRSRISGGGVRKTSDRHKLRSGRGAIDQFRVQLDELVAALQLHVHIRGGS
jgi:hypothetical protein